MQTNHFLPQTDATCTVSSERAVTDRPTKMKRIASATLFGFIALELTGCQTAPVDPAQDAQTAALIERTETRLPGVFEGVLPCADCAGIRTAIYLRATGTYTRISHYMGTDGAFEEAGSWRADPKGLDGRYVNGKRSEEKGGAGILIVFEPMNSSDHVWYALAGEKTLTLLDREGNVIEGGLAPLYVLEKP